MLYSSICSHACIPFFQVVSYGIGKATVKEEFETVVEDEDEGITGDDAAEDGIAMDPMEVLSNLSLHLLACR